MALTKSFAVISGFDASNTTDTTTAFNSTGFTHVVAFCKHEGASTSITFSDNKSSNFTGNNQTYISNANGDLNAQMSWAAIGSPGTGHTVTVTFGSARAFARTGVWLINATSGTIAVISGTDVTAQGNDTTPDAGSITTSEASAIFMACGEYTNVSYTPSTGWTEDWDPNGTGSIWSFGASRLEASGGTFDPSCTQSSSAAWVCCAVAFKEVTGGGGGNPLMGQICL